MASTAVPSAPPKPPKRPAPFKAHGSGVRATGEVTELRKHPEGSDNVRVTVQHRKVKEGTPGFYDGGHESSFVMPGDQAGKFPMGSRVQVHVRPFAGAQDPAEPDADDAAPKKKPAGFVRRATKK